MTATKAKTFGSAWNLSTGAEAGNGRGEKGSESVILCCEVVCGLRESDCSNPALSDELALRYRTKARWTAPWSLLWSKFVWAKEQRHSNQQGEIINRKKLGKHFSASSNIPVLESEGCLTFTFW